VLKSQQHISGDAGYFRRIFQQDFQEVLKYGQGAAGLMPPPPLVI
jgi:hypothetical protein